MNGNFNNMNNGMNYKNSGANEKMKKQPTNKKILSFLIIISVLLAVIAVSLVLLVLKNDSTVNRDGSEIIIENIDEDVSEEKDVSKKYYSQKDNTDEKETKKGEIKILDSVYVEEDYAICVDKDNTELLEKINEALAELKDEGVIQEIVDKYKLGTEHDLVFQVGAERKPELHMATNATFSPYEYYEDGEIVGIDIEIASAIADKLDMKLVIDDMNFDAIVVAVRDGLADMGMAAMMVTEERLKYVNFSEIYTTVTQSIIVPEGSKIKSVDDLYADGAKYLVGTQKGTIGDIYAVDDFGADRVKVYETGNEAVQALKKSKVDCVILDFEVAEACMMAEMK